MGSTTQSVNDLVSSLPDKLDIKARSLLVTIWGDSIAPRGGTAWLGSLIDLAGSFGLNERAVRTSVFRLKNERILSSRQQGRKSFYTLTPSGELLFQEATKRIYSHLPKTWNGEWLLIFSERRKLSDPLKRQLAMELGWLGFGELGAGIYAHPNCAQEIAERVVNKLGLSAHIAFMKAAELPISGDFPAHIIVEKGWNLPEIEQSYTDFITHFSPIQNALKSATHLTPEHSFMLRTLLVHEYRRALLRDPTLPERLLPANWSGNLARELFYTMYRLIWQNADQYLLQKLETRDGRVPDVSVEFTSRFGGLQA